MRTNTKITRMIVRNGISTWVIVLSGRSRTLLVSLSLGTNYTGGKGMPGRDDENPMQRVRWNGIRQSADPLAAPPNRPHPTSRVCVGNWIEDIVAGKWRSRPGARQELEQSRRVRIAVDRVGIEQRFALGHGQHCAPVLAVLVCGVVNDLHDLVPAIGAVMTARRGIGVAQIGL